MAVETIYESYGNKLIGTDRSGGSSEQVQADWNQSDNTAVDYIKNKPSTTSSVTSGSSALVTSGAVYSYVDTMITQALSGSY